MELFFLAILVITMATALGSGFPVAFALPGSAIITIILAGISGFIFSGDPSAFFHQGGPFQWISSGVTNLRGVYWEVERDTLIAIPLFIFMGIMLQKSKIAEDLLVTMANLFGPVPGGLGISVVFVGALLAATTGIVGATVVAMGLISLPAMLRNNYSQSLATGTIAASGTLGQIIPPSIVLIILADQLGSAADQAGSARKSLFKEATGEISMPSMFDVGSTSAGEMFLGALVPGLILVGLYMVFILVYALIRPKVAPAVRYEGNLDIKFWVNVLLTLVPPLGLIFLVLGSIITGIATVNQAGAIGAGGALIMAGYRLTEGSKGRYYPAILAIISLLIISYCLSNFDMNVKAVIATGANKTGIWIGLFGSILLILSLIWSGVRVLNLNNTMHEVMLETAKTTSLVFIILLGAAVLTAAFRAFGGEELVRNFLNSMPGGFWAKFVIVMAITITNLAQNPPGIELRKLRTNSSPPKARNAAVNTAAPNRMINTSEVVLAVSSITSCIVLFKFSTLTPLQINESISKIEPKSPIQIPVLLAPVAITAFTFISKFDKQYDIINKDIIASMAG